MEEELPYEGEGIDVGEGAPQTKRDDHIDNPDEENAGEEADEEQGNEQSQSKSTVCRLLQEINQCYSLEETEPSKIQNHCLLIPKVEETSDSKKEPDYEKATTVSSESLNPHPFARMKKIDKLAATSSASVTTGVPYEDLLVKVAERKTSRLQNRANHPPPRYEKNRIPLLSQNLRSPFEPGTQVKGSLNRYAKLYTLTELEEVVYGKVAESKVAELTFFMSRKDSVYPIGSPTRASEFFEVFMKRRELLEDEHMDAALSFYRLRFQEHPSMFPSTKIAIMDVAFQMLWAHQYENWKANEALPGGMFFYYYGLAPRYAETKMWGCSVKESGGAVCYNGSLRVMVLRKEKRKPSVDRTDFKIECIWNGVPRARHPFGDCGVYTLKFLECLMMGVEFKPKFLKDVNMGVVRKNLTAAMYVETARANANMWDPEFIDGKATATVGQFKADDTPAGSMLLPCSFKMSSCNSGSLACLKENQKKQRQGDNVFAIYPQIDGKATATVGQFKADDSPAGSLMLPCSVQLAKLGKL
ncbi:hypothetical protein DY000_02040002 [Brassica cretica]|uniref:Ubiquitin-like protease family profile domain-containing protein n=1 Tax=Brassica cretica TaxID=69181 RepID=A0ABQ7BD85_BRACR|nr:hypothetical protein DY000_02040002 [Brassica cretica]